jgi:glycosyltransferase involved in cell wall biosynthesis
VILFITRQIPYPPNAGVRIRQLQLLEAYAGVSPVHLVFNYLHEAELAGVPALEQLCAGVHPVPFSWCGRPARPGLPHWWKDLRTHHQLRSFRSGHFFSREMRQTIAAMAPACRVIHVDSLFMATHAEAALRRRTRQQRLILDLDDVETRVQQRWLRVSPLARWSARIAGALDLALVAREQSRALRRFDRVLVCSQQDWEYVGGTRNLVVIPNGTDVRRGPLPDTSDGRTLLCLGTYGHWPNVDGLLFFLREIVPLVRAEVRELRVLVVGNDVPPDVARLHDGHGVIVSADVPSVEPYYRQATASVVPLRVAGGTRLKILEAFALGRPVVSTSVGCEGLEVADRQHLLIADEPAAFARSCVELLRDPGFRAQIATQGRALAERQYSWESIRHRAAQLATDLLRDDRSPATVRTEGRPEALQ